ncbi:MAG: hypothetical protein ABIP89_08785, partial [Polyangiaceae bacterium]
MTVRTFPPVREIAKPRPPGVRERAHPEEAAPCIPQDRNEAMLELAGRRVRLTNLQKIFFAHGGITKRALIQYYLDVGPTLLPHLAQRAMVMKRYPNG